MTIIDHRPVNRAFAVCDKLSGNQMVELLRRLDTAWRNTVNHDGQWIANALGYAADVIESNLA